MAEKSGGDWLESAMQEFRRQPLAVSLQFLAVMIALPSLAATFGWLTIPSIAGFSLSANESSAIGLSATTLLLLSALSALVSRHACKFTDLGGFCLSLILANIVMLLSMLPLANSLTKGAAVDSGKLASPLIDLVYWGTLFVFFGINGEYVARKFARDTEPKKKTEGHEDGTGLMGILFLGAFLWGTILSSGQQKILKLMLPLSAFQIQVLR